MCKVFLQYHSVCSTCTVRHMYSDIVLICQDSNQGDIVVSIKDNTIYFWEIKEEAIKAFYVTAKFTPLKNNIYE